MRRVFDVEYRSIFICVYENIVFAVGCALFYPDLSHNLLVALRSSTDTLTI